MGRYERSSVIDAPVERVFAFHERPDAVKLLTPAWLLPRVERLRGEGLEAGVELIVTTLLGPWHAMHTAYVRDRLFVDEIVSGPFRKWRHEHRFEALLEEGAPRTLLTDSMTFEHKFAPAWAVQPGLALLFAYRHRVTRKFCEARGGER